MIKLIKFIKDFNKKSEKPITESEVKMAMIVNHHLLIKRYERMQKKVS